MQIEARKYGLGDLIRLPVQAGTRSAMLVALHSLLSGITPTLHVLVTARFIHTAIALLQGSTERSQIYGRLLAVVVLIAYTWISGAVAKLANLRLGLALQERYHTAIMEKRALISTLIIVVLLNPVLTGALSVGLFMSLVGATFGIVQMMSWELIQSIDQLVKYREYLKDLTKFAMLEESDSAQQPLTEPVPEFRSLEFRNVSFQYPGTDKYVLKNLSFKMEAGKHYSFVGICDRRLISAAFLC